MNEPIEVDIDAAQACVVTTLRHGPIGTSTRCTPAEDAMGRYPAPARATAHSLVARAATLLREEGVVGVLRPRSWDRSGDVRTDHLPPRQTRTRGSNEHGMGHCIEGGIRR